MIKNWKQYLEGHHWAFHLLVTLLIAWITRMVCSFYVYGPQALDDYVNSVIPAYKHFLGQDPGLIRYRSPMIVWLLSGSLKIADFFAGPLSPVNQVRWMYMTLGTLSLTGVVGAIYYARAMKNSLWFGTAYLMALWALMPFVTTRAFGESIAIGFVLLGFGLMEFGRLENSRPHFISGVISLGIAVIFRNQAGLLPVGYFLYLLYIRDGKRIFDFVAANLVILGLQIAMDLSEGKYPLETLVLYFDANKNVGKDYGVHPWHATWLTVLGATLFPFSAPLYFGLRKFFREHAPVAWPMLLFVFVHGLIDHKEDRFMYPILGLLAIMLTSFWITEGQRKSVRYFATPAFVLLNLILLPIVMVTNTQVGEMEPAAVISSLQKKTLYLDLNSPFGDSDRKDFFIRSPSSVEKRQTQVTNVELASRFAEGWDVIAILTGKLSDALELKNLGCSQLQTAESLSDKILLFLNPAENARRKPTYYVICEKH